MEVIALILNRLYNPKIGDVLTYLESMYMVNETLDFIEYARLSMVNKALYDFVNKIGFKCFKLCREDYLIYKTLVQHGDKALFYIDDINLCDRFLQLFGYVYNSAETIVNGTHTANYIHPGRSIGIEYFYSRHSPLNSASKNNISKAKFLLTNITPIDMLDDPAFLWHAKINGEDIFNFIFENSLYKNNIDDLIKVAIKYAHYDAVKYLLDKNPNLYSMDNGRLPIMNCCNGSTFRMILEKMDLNVLYNGKNLLEYVIYYNNNLHQPIKSFNGMHPQNIAKEKTKRFCESTIHEYKIKILKEAFTEYKINN